MTLKSRLLMTLGATAAAVAGGQALLRRFRTWDLAGRNVLVTGGSRGLGLVLARELVREGARVAICARDEDTLDRARAELQHEGVAIALRCDLTEPGDVSEMVKQVVARLGPIDALINNAGIITVGPLDAMTREDFERAMRTNFWGPLNAILAVLPDMRARRMGRIVNVASIGGKISVPHLIPYSASKFALVGLSEGLRTELARDGIQVVTICPGLMRTGSPRHAEFKGNHRAEYAWFSISDALPGLSMDAGRAAREIVLALRVGEPGRILSMPAKLGALVHGLFPGLTAEVLSAVNRALPAAPVDSRQPVKGEASASRLSPSWLTRLGDRAAVQNNQTA